MPKQRYFVRIDKNEMLDLGQGLYTLEHLQLNVGLVFQEIKLFKKYKVVGGKVELKEMK